ncbi:hypothetical protein EW146_g7817 [Bondarzewia mesenterica]|uniref:Protein CASP n=1 Tax=Bondarzewia mesenterica TaxID=1095465 RepID=A0A4S4LJV5_9AGAM|nr:hypothetical protein EW146_g7817 [Bondarzewia mesenterica]
MASPETNFSGALATWKSINLSELQKTLDTQGIEVVENQKESVVGRKALADRTKEFKKIPDGEKLTAFKGLLKAYQSEIDGLTKRSKSAENAFLSVYKVLAEAPDPYPLLEAAVDQTIKIAETRDLEAELQRVRNENAELKKRVSDFGSTENAKKKTETRLEQLEEKACRVMDSMIQEKVAQKENELNAAYDEKIRNYEEREQDLHRQLSLVKDQIRDLRTSNESNQARLLDQSQRQDQDVLTNLAEVDMVVADLERANTRVATVERRNELLRVEIESLRSGNETSDRVKDLKTQVFSLESETERLSHLLATQKTETVEVESVARKALDDSTKEIQSKYVEFAGLEGDLDADDSPAPDNELGLRLPDPNATKANAHQAKSLEVLLATKNKRILEELTKFRILHGELEASLQQIRDELASTASELEKQRALNERLETDLLQLNKHGQSQGQNGKTHVNGTDVPQTEFDSDEDVLAGLDLGKKAKSRANDSPARTTPIPFTSSADTSILPIVTSQRDRFRQRNAELEEELRRQFQIISDLRTEIRSLQTDNLKLYEKVRYMQSYRENTTTSTLDPLPAGPSNAASAAEMSKYRVRYEEAMNPFEAFRGREAARAYSNLNPLERGVLVLTRAILGNRRARNAFILYAVALHALVMFTTYECTISSGRQLQQQPGPYGS